MFCILLFVDNHAIFVGLYFLLCLTYVFLAALAAKLLQKQVQKFKSNILKIKKLIFTYSIHTHYISQILGPLFRQKRKLAERFIDGVIHFPNGAFCQQIFAGVCVITDSILQDSVPVLLQSVIRNAAVVTDV